MAELTEETVQQLINLAQQASNAPMPPTAISLSAPQY